MNLLDTDEHDSVSQLLASATPPPGAFADPDAVVAEGHRRRRRRTTGRVAVAGVAASLVGALGIASATGLLDSSAGATGPDLLPADSPTTVQTQEVDLPGLESPPLVAATVADGPDGEQQIDVTVMHAGRGFDDTFEVRSGDSADHLGSPTGLSRAMTTWGYVTDPGAQGCFSARLVHGKDRSPWSEPVCATAGDPSSSVPLDTPLHQSTVGQPPQDGAADERVSVVHEHLDAGEVGSLGIGPVEDGPRETFWITTADGGAAPFAVDPTSFAERGLLVPFDRRQVLVTPAGGTLEALADPQHPDQDVVTEIAHAPMPGGSAEVDVATVEDSAAGTPLVGIWRDSTGYLHATDGSAVHRAEITDPLRGDPLVVWLSPSLGAWGGFSWDDTASMPGVRSVPRLDTDGPQAYVAALGMPDDQGGSTYLVALPKGARLTARMEDRTGSLIGSSGAGERLGSSGLDLYVFSAGPATGDRLTLAWQDAGGTDHAVPLLDPELSSR